MGPQINSEEQIMVRNTRSVRRRSQAHSRRPQNTAEVSRAPRHGRNRKLLVALEETKRPDRSALWACPRPACRLLSPACFCTEHPGGVIFICLGLIRSHLSLSFNALGEIYLSRRASRRSLLQNANRAMSLSCLVTSSGCSAYLARSPKPFGASEAVWAVTPGGPLCPPATHPCCGSANTPPVRPRREGLLTCSPGSLQNWLLLVIGVSAPRSPASQGARLKPPSPSPHVTCYIPGANSLWHV